MKSVLVVGTGSIGERHLRCFQNLESGVVAGCEPNAALREKIADTYGCEVFSALDEALASRSWTAVVICTPAHTHIPIATRCAEMGIHLLLEKPLSTSLDGIPALIQTAAGRGLVARVAYVHRSIPTVMAARKLLLSGVTGAVKHVVATAGQHFPTARPAYASTYFARRESGGGCIQDAITHTIHAVEWLVAPFTRVFCDASHQALAGVEVEDTVNVVGRLRGDIPVSVVQNQFQAPSELCITIHGLLGSVRVELHRQRVGFLPLGGQDWQWSDLPPEERDGMFVRQARSFLGAIDGEPDDLATLEDGLQTLKVNLAALRSADERKEFLI